MKKQGKSPRSKVARIAVTSIKVEQGKLDRLTEIAEANHRSRASQIRFLIDRCLAESEKDAA